MNRDESNRAFVMNQLSETEQKLLADQGFLPPYGSVWQEVDLDRIRRKLLVHMSNRADKHPLYGRYSTRDWHLVYPELTRLVSHPSILGRLKTPPRSGKMTPLSIANPGA